MSYYDSFAGTDAGGFNNSVAEQQVCSQFLVLNFRYIYIYLPPEVMDVATCEAAMGAMGRSALAAQFW